MTTQKSTSILKNPFVIIAALVLLATVVFMMAGTLRNKYLRSHASTGVQVAMHNCPNSTYGYPEEVTNNRNKIIEWGQIADVPGPYYVTLDLFKQNSTGNYVYNSRIASHIPSDNIDNNKYTWLVPASLVGPFKIQVSSETSPNYYDLSDGYCNAVSLSVNVYYPNGGVTLTSSTDLNVQWYQVGDYDNNGLTPRSQVNIYLDKFDGQNYTHFYQVGSNIPNNQSSGRNANYIWTIPWGISGNNFKINVSLVDDTNIQDSSDMEFTIQSPPTQLTLVKQVINDNGGTATASAWTLTATGPTTISGAGGVDSGPSLPPGTYTLAESGGSSGYSASAWSCTGGSFSGTQITLVAGNSVTCTITNDDIAPKLTLIKHVVNDSGGNMSVANFVLKIDGVQVTSGTPVILNTGSHTASEISLARYAASGWTGDCSTNGAITLGLGDNKTCEITNNDFPPVACKSTSSTVKIRAAANFTASGGDNTFSWLAPGGTPSTGSGASFTTTFSSIGSKTVTVSSASTTANCTVNVTRSGR